MYTGKFHKYPVAGICLAGIQDDHIENIVKIVSNALNAKGFKVMIFNAFTNAYFDTPYAKGEAAVFDIINFDIVDVLVILPETIKNPELCNKIAQRAISAGTPVFVLDGTIDGCTNITYEYEKSMEDVVEHIVTVHGCTDLFFIAGMRDNAFSDERIAAFKRVLDRHGIPFDEDTMLDYGDFWSVPTEEAVERLFSREKKLPQAIICANDSMAVTAMKVLSDHSVNVPEDVIVTGFDAILQKRIYSTTRLTTSVVNCEELAQAVSEAAYGYINNKKMPSEIKVGLSFVHGQSCGCRDFDEEYTDDMLEQMNKYNTALSDAESRIASFFSKVAYSNTIEELASSIRDFMNYRSWLCINDDLLNEEADLSQRIQHGSFTKNMTAYVMRHWDEYEYDLKYKAETMLPKLGTMLKRYNTIIFLPIHFQEQTAGYYAAVADDLLTGPGSFYYVQRLVNSIEQALENFRTEYLLKKANKELLQTQSIDPLTGLYNRRGYFEHIDNLIRQNGKADVIMICCDMDRLKEINDNYSHHDGDIAITTVSDAIKKSCGKKGICARFGGDEFVLTAPSSNCERELPKIIGEIQTHIDKFNRSSGKPYEVSISVGGSFGTIASAEDIDGLLRSTDQLMYEQKRLKKAPHALLN
ncbi:MAG: GGDEF domain-containing protein, partial [Ruminiclostridium sp.]